MRIIINAYQYANSITGTDRMAANFLKQLQKIDTKNTYFIVCSAETYIPKAVSSANFKILRPPRLKSLYGQRLINKTWRTISPLIILSLRADVYFSFHNMRLPQYRIAKQMIASNLDLIPLRLAEYAALEPKLINEIKRTAKNADHFMAISNFSKDELSQVLNVNPKKITAISLAADPMFGEGKSETPKISGKYIFTIGGSEPRKNVQNVIKAYKKLPEGLKNQYNLVIAGGNWHGQKLSDTATDPNIVSLGYVPDNDLPNLYANATVFVFASKYEGFGFTILEAMASGVPVISAHGSSLDEVAGDAALMFDPNNPSELADKMERVLTDTKLQKKLIEKGCMQNKKFSWEKAARQLHKVLTQDV